MERNFEMRKLGSSLLATSNQISFKRVSFNKYLHVSRLLIIIYYSNLESRPGDASALSCSVRPHRGRVTTAQGNFNFYTTANLF